MTGSLVLNQLQAGYGRARVVRGIDLECKPGEITALLGRNGVGKTTTLSTIAGLIPTSGGSVTFDGQTVLGPPYRRCRNGFALVQEGKRVFRERSVEDNLVIGAFGARLGRRGVQEGTDAAYERFPILREKRKDRAGSLSGGQQQMLAISQALMGKPRVLMLDEPSAGLAPVVVDEVFGAIAELKKDGLCVLLVEQLIDNSLAVADHVAVLDHGVLVINQTVASLKNWDVLREVYLGTSVDDLGGDNKKAMNT